MKRYTLTFTSPHPSISTTELKTELEQVMLRLHPRITYKIFRVISDEVGSVFVHILMDGKCKLLEEVIRDRQWRQPVKVKSIGWGWEAGNDSHTESAAIAPLGSVDPLKGFESISGFVEFRVNDKRLWLRYLFLVASTIIMILLLMANSIYNHSLVLRFVYIAGFLVWIFALNETPIDPRVFTEKIYCNLDGLEVKYHFRLKPIQLGWDEIWGMDFAEPVCQVYTAEKKRRFMVSERFGFKDQKTLLKTIVQMSGLNYVGGDFIKMEYRRYDAPPAN